MRIFRESVSPEEPCVYLPEQRAQLQYRAVDRCSADEYQQMLEEGWRRFGRVFFRPVCSACRECRSLRVDVHRFQWNRSRKRNLQRNKDLRVILRQVSISRQHLQLYDRYHNDMAVRKNWREKSIDPVEYYETFVDGYGSYGHELLFLEGERLLGVAMIDLLPAAVSAVYCYYDPEERHRGLGVFSVLQHLEVARIRNIPYVYLGFWIAGNASMKYKSGFRPHEILQGRPSAGEEPRWLLTGANSEPVCD